MISVKAKGMSVAERCGLANNFVSRLVGLLNHSSLEPGEGLIIEPCNQVHTFFMRFSIDAVFLTKDNVITKVSELKPWRMTAMSFGARKVLELPLGTARRLGLKAGDQLEVTEC